MIGQVVRRGARNTFFVVGTVRNKIVKSPDLVTSEELLNGHVKAELPGLCEGN